MKEPWELSEYDRKRYMKHQREFRFFKCMSQDYSDPYWTLRAALALYRMYDMLGGLRYERDENGELRAVFKGLKAHRDAGGTLVVTLKEEQQ